MKRLLRSMKARVREFLLLEEAERRSAALTPAQREASRGLYDVALRRLRAAQDLRLRNELGAALLLYQEGGLHLARAYLLSREPDANPPVDARTVVDELGAVLASAGEPVPPYFARAQSFLMSSDPFEFDRLAAGEARRVSEELELTAAWLARLMNPVSPSEVKIRRVVRLTIAGTLVVALLAGVALWALSPRNVALHARATSSSQAYETTPAGAVDGRRFGQLGFHTNGEESPWLAIDLGQKYAIWRVKVYGRSDCCFDQSIPLALEASDDGVTYAIVSERTDPFSAYEPWEAKPGKFVARFIRLRTMKNAVLVLSEVEVNGRPAK